MINLLHLIVVTSIVIGNSSKKQQLYSSKYLCT